jgi:hypothetical protein
LAGESKQLKATPDSPPIRQQKLIHQPPIRQQKLIHQPPIRQQKLMEDPLFILYSSSNQAAKADGGSSIHSLFILQSGSKS